MRLKHHITVAYTSKNAKYGHTNILWVGKHSPLLSQIRYLENKIGPIKIVAISGMVTDAETVLKAAEANNVAYIIPILPMSFIAKLIKMARGKYVFLWADMKLIHKRNVGEISNPYECELYNPETDIIIFSPNVIRHLRFQRFRIIKEVRLVLEPF